MKFKTILILLLVCSSLARIKRLSLGSKEYIAPLTETQIKNYKKEFITGSIELLKKLEKETKLRIEQQKAIQMEKLTLEPGQSSEDEQNKITKMENLFSTILTEIQHPFTILKALFKKENKQKFRQMVGNFSNFVYCATRMSKLTQNAEKLLPEYDFDPNKIVRSLHSTELNQRIEEAEDICDKYYKLRSDKNHSYFNAEHEQLERMRIRFNSYIILAKSGRGLSDIAGRGSFDILVNKNTLVLKAIGVDR